jgi:sirohydrochlorin ferrochelatase
LADVPPKTDRAAPRALIIVDHGSRRPDSNRLLEQTVAAFATRFMAEFPIVEPAHMELAEPSIANAYARCVERGASLIICAPFFLGPGRHWTTDIPALLAGAATAHPHTTWHLAPPLGPDDLLLRLLFERATRCLECQLQCERCTANPGSKPTELPPATGL